VTALVPDNIGCWRDRAKLPVDLLDAGGAALGGKLYVVGGKDAVAHRSRAFAYDPRFDHWFRVPSLPGPAVENPAVVARGGRLYVIGGSTEPFSGAVARVTSYDPHRNRWRSLTPMPTPRGGATAQVLGGKIYVAGGLDASGASLSRVEVFDPSDGPTGSWSSAPPMSVRRDNPGSAALSGRLYVFGGRTRNADGSTVDGALTSVEMYDPSTGDWKSRASMPTGRRTMAVGTLNGRAQLIGGEGSAVAPGTFYANEEYDPATDSWRTLTSMPTPRHGAAAGTIGGVVYTVGGGPQSGSSFSRLNQAFSFAPFGNPAPLPRCHGHPATIVGDSGPNRLAGTKRTDVIVAKAGRDLIHGYGGRDVICGGGGRDRLLGGGGRDLLLGQGGADPLFGGRAADRLVGGAAGDWLFGGPGPDRLFGGRRDRLFGGRGRDFCALGRSGVRAGCERPR
jgi:N-acetylneuraminic acid mutarotase